MWRYYPRNARLEAEIEYMNRFAQEGYVLQRQRGNFRQFAKVAEPQQVYLFVSHESTLNTGYAGGRVTTVRLQPKLFLHYLYVPATMRPEDLTVQPGEDAYMDYLAYMRQGIVRQEFGGLGFFVLAAGIIGLAMLVPPVGPAVIVYILAVLAALGVLALGIWRLFRAVNNGLFLSGNQAVMTPFYVVITILKPDMLTDQEVAAQVARSVGDGNFRLVTHRKNAYYFTVTNLGINVDELRIELNDALGDRAKVQASYPGHGFAVRLQ